MNHWVFTCNPKRYAVFDEWLEYGVEFSWWVTRYADELADGDHAALWVGGPPALRGIWAVGVVAGVSEESFTSEGWVDPAERGMPGLSVPLHFEHVFLPRRGKKPGDCRPILATDLVDDKRFSDSSLIRQPFAGNPHRISEGAWRAIEERIGPSARHA